MAFWCYGKNGFCDKKLCSALCVYYDGKGGEERESIENQNYAASDAPQWISVNDKLPEQDVYVLCYYTDSGKYQYQTVGRLWSANGKWDLDIDSEYDIENEKVVTHWMPLPEPPKEADNANE